MPSLQPVVEVRTRTAAVDLGKDFSSASTPAGGQTPDVALAFANAAGGNNLSVKGGVGDVPAENQAASPDRDKERER